MTMSLYLFLDMYLHSGEYHVGTVGIDIRNNGNHQLETHGSEKVENILHVEKHSCYRYIGQSV